MGMETAWLSFWRVKPGKKAKPQATYDALQDGKEPATLDDLPVDDILAAIKKQYPRFDPKAEFAEIDIPKEQTTIEPRWNKKHFHFTFFGDAFKQMDRVTKLMTRLGLACYDAGTKTMYSVEQPPPSFQGAPDDQIYDKALDKTLSEAAAKARATATNPQERLKMLKDFIDSGAAKAALDAELQRLKEKKPKKQNPRSRSTAPSYIAGPHGLRPYL